MLSSPSALNGGNALRLYKEVGDVIQFKGGGILKLRGLATNKDISSFYFDPQFQYYPRDLCHEMIEDAKPTI